MLVGVLPMLSLNMVPRAGASGRGMYILFSNRRLMAESNTQGMFVAPRTNIPSLSLPTPYSNIKLIIEISGNLR